MLVPSEALFFYVLVRHALRSAGVDDRELADYLAALLLEFGQRDRAWRVDWNDDQRHRYLVDILADLEASDGERRFRVMVHLGNYALWLAGLFPDYIAARHLRKAGPDVTLLRCARAAAASAWRRITRSPPSTGSARCSAPPPSGFRRVRERAQRRERPAAFPTVSTPDRILRDLGAH